MDKIKGAVKDLPILRGERRVPKPMGARVHLYSDVLSTRTRMKREAARAECALQRQAEPFAAISWALGREYPAALLDGAWKLLLRSTLTTALRAPALTIRARHVPPVAAGRQFPAGNAAQSEHIQRHIDNGDIEKEDRPGHVFNPSPIPRRK
jgi:hypothetical protein